MSELNYFLVIPASVWNDKTLSPAAERLYSRISGLTRSRGYCFASNDYFAELLGTTPRTVQRWLMELKRAGHIRIELEGPIGNKRKIMLNVLPSPTTNLSPPHDKNVVHTHDKNVVHNNIRSTVLNKNKSTPTPIAEFLDSLRADPYFEGIDIDAEFERAVLWCEKKNRALTQRFFRDWLARADRPDLEQDDEPEPVEEEEWTEERACAALQLYPGMIMPPPMWKIIPLDIREAIDAKVLANREKKAGGRNAGTNGVGLNGSHTPAQGIAGGSEKNGSPPDVVAGKTVLKEDTPP